MTRFSIVLTILFLNWALISPHALSRSACAERDEVVEHNNINAAALGSSKPSTCRPTEIAVIQGLESTKGIPSYRVEITNLCACAVAKLHLHCRMFASANVVNPNLFKRIADDDCLVNAGKAIPTGKVIAFRYSNTRPYPLSVASYVCEH